MTKMKLTAKQIGHRIAGLKRSLNERRSDLATLSFAERHVVKHTPAGDRRAAQHIASLTRRINQITQALATLEEAKDKLPFRRHSTLYRGFGRPRKTDLIA